MHFPGSVVFNLFFILNTLLHSLVVLLLGRWLGFTRLVAIGDSWGRLNLLLLRIFCGIRYRLEGIENIPDEPCIFVSNHQSAWETTAFRTLLPHNQVYVLKEELLAIPVFGPTLRHFGSIAINRTQGKQALRQIVSDGKKALAAGRHIIIFPEGTRVQPGSLGKFNIGAAFLASGSGAPVVPIVHNSGCCWGKAAFLKRPGTIRVVIGTAIGSQDKSPKQLNQELNLWMAEHLPGCD